MDEELGSQLASLDNAEACCQEGEQLLKDGRPADAIGFFQKAVQLDSKSQHGWFGQGMALTHMEEYAASVDHFRRVIKLNPKLPIAHHNLGRSLHEIGESDMAYQSFKRAMYLGFAPTQQAVAIAVPGFPSASNQIVLRERRKWAKGLLAAEEIDPGGVEIVAEKTKKPLKLGYVSAFFHKENWMKPVWGLLEQHDREAFQVHLFSDRTKLTPGIDKFLRPGDRFHDISALSNEEAADLIKAHDIDILIDLNGYSFPPRFPVFLRKPAPLAIGWFNMYATTGFDCFDYLIGDNCVIPAEEERYYSEKIVRVSGSYLTFTVGYDVPDLSPPPCIENGHVTFGSLISQYKITDKVIRSWCKILKATPDSRLLLRNASLAKDSNQQYLLSQFVKRGISAERITMLGPAAHYEFLETYGLIDIALDAFPYNGGTTTTEAIWQGVPVVTYWGNRWVSRTSATLLRSAGLDELVAKDVLAYVRLATQLAADPQKLKAMREAMREQLLASDVCDTVAFARSMERLYVDIWQS